MLAPTTMSTLTWPISGDVPDLLVVVEDQAQTIRDQEILLHAYQSNLNAAQQVTGVASGTGTGSGTNLTVSSVIGTISTPELVIGPSTGPGALIPFGTMVTGQTSGPTGGAGVYVTSQATTASGTPVTFQPGAAATAAVATSVTGIVLSGNVGTIVNGAVVKDQAGAVLAGTTVLGQISGTTGGAGTYLISHPVTFGAPTLLTFASPAGAFGQSWPIPQDAPTLNLIAQTQTAVMRTQSALLQHYQDLLNQSQTAPPATGP